MFICFHAFVSESEAEKSSQTSEHMLA